MNAENRLVEVSGDVAAIYPSDSLSRRICKAFNSATPDLVYDQSRRPVEETGGSGPCRRGEVFTGGQRIAKAPATQAPGATEYYHGDHLGSARLMTDASGNVIPGSDATFLPFGERYEPSAAADHSGFTGHEHDAETDTYHTWFRQLAWRQGRWASPDPYDGSMDLSDPQSLNRYAYVGGNPTNYFDPLGLDRTQTVIVGRCTFNLTWGYPDGEIHGREKIVSYTVDCTPGDPAPIAVEGPQPNGGGGDSGGGGILAGIKKSYCSAVPSGRSTSISVGLGGIGAVHGGGDVVVNYNSGQTSLFATGALSAGWNGGLSGTVSTGLVYGLGNTNDGFSGNFKGGNFSVTTPAGLTAGGSIVRGGGVTVISGGVGAALVGRFGGGGAVSATSKPLNVGKFTAYAPVDYVGYFLRRPCNF